MFEQTLAARSARWSSWRRWPRETRDTLFLLGMLGWTVLPHTTHVPLWCTGLTATLLIWRAWLTCTHQALPERWVLLLGLAVVAGLTGFTFGSLVGKDAGVTMAVALAALKTLELRARRDAFVVFLLGFFLVLTHFLYSQSPAVAAAMLISVWGLLTCLVLAHMPVGQPSLQQAAGLAGRTAAWGIPIMALLFVLFPRIGPLWGVPKAGGSAGTGLSTSMRMGSVAQIALDDAVALRIRFEGPVPAQEHLYFRGPVLSTFDGLEWRAEEPAPLTAPAGDQAGLAAQQIRSQEPVLSYEMTLVPSTLNILPLLEASPTAPQIKGYQVRPGPAMQWWLDRPVSSEVRVQAQAQVPFQQGPWRYDLNLSRYLALPIGANPRMMGWAAQLQTESRWAQAKPEALAKMLLNHIRSENYSYTLEPGEYLGYDALDAFWFDRRQGFCEHFAASFVVLMRAMGVPARVVTGYQGAEKDTSTGPKTWVVRQSSAHAWAEYWQIGKGWVRTDPTAAVAPERIQRHRALQTPRGVVADTLSRVSPALWESVQSSLAYLQTQWNQQVLSYTRGNQLNLLSKLGFKDPNWEDLAKLLIVSISSAALAGAAWAWWDRRRINPWAKQMQALRQCLTRLQVSSADQDTPRTLAKRLTDKFGVRAQALCLLLITLEKQRYSQGALQSPQNKITKAFTLATRTLLRQQSSHSQGS
jgi:protein-glutamine gamma-glutamyltransferase